MMPEVPSALLFLIFRAFIRVEKIEEEVRFCLVHALDRAFAVDLAMRPMIFLMTALVTIWL